MMAGQEKRTKKETPSAKELQKKMRWLLNSWAKVLIAGAETSRDFGCCRMVKFWCSTRRHFVFGHFLPGSIKGS